MRLFIFWALCLLCLAASPLWPQPQAQSTEFYRTIKEWSGEIQKHMLRQDFRSALALCLEAQQQYPEQQMFRDYEASIREYLQAEQRSSEADEQLPGVYEEEEIQITLRQRLVAEAKQDPLLAVHGSVGLHRGLSVDGMTVLNPLAGAALNLYFSSSLGINLFYYGLHWDLRLEHTPSKSIPSTLYSLAFGGSLRFRNKFNDFLNRGLLSFALDIGVGLYDLFPLLLKDYQPKLVLLLGFNFSDRPFYHFFALEVLAGLQIDLNLSLYLSLEPNAPSVVQTGNVEAILWQSFGVLRLGLSYRGSLSEYYDRKQVFFVQHQFALLVGLEWRTSFQR